MMNYLHPQQRSPFDLFENATGNVCQVDVIDSIVSNTLPYRDFQVIVQTPARDLDGNYHRWRSEELWNGECSVCRSSRYILRRERSRCASRIDPCHPIGSPARSKRLLRCLVRRSRDVCTNHNLRASRVVCVTHPADSRISRSGDRACPGSRSMHGRSTCSP